MWHTKLIGTKPSLGFRLAGERPRVSDMFIESRFHHSRNDPDGMVFRARGTNQWSVENVWITHVHGGFWLNRATNGSVRGCRIYGTYADGINLNRGSSQNVIEDCYIRTAGDDGIATLAETKDEDVVTSNNIFRHNTVIANWWGHNIDVAGGEGHIVEDNYLADNSHSGCFTFNLPSAYPMHPLINAIVRRNTIVRGGGNHAGQQRGAIWSFADDAPIQGVVFEENRIVAPVFRGLHLHGGAAQEVVFKDNLIDKPGTDAVRIDESVTGSLKLINNQIVGLGNSAQKVDNAAENEFHLIEEGTRVD
jgi:parallel beta-helix repeat protein